VEQLEKGVREEESSLYFLQCLQQVNEARAALLADELRFTQGGDEAKRNSARSTSPMLICTPKRLRTRRASPKLSKPSRRRSRRRTAKASNSAICLRISRRSWTASDGWRTTSGYASRARCSSSKIACIWARHHRVSSLSKTQRLNLKVTGKAKRQTTVCPLG